MREAVRRFALLLAPVLFVASAQAEWSKTLSVDYLMGDGDSRVTARQVALEQIKRKASDEAGTYIQSTSTLTEGGELSETIQMIGASMVKLGEVQESLTVNKTGQVVLRVEAHVAIDDAELSRRIKALQQDKEKARQIAALQEENEALRRDVAEIRTALTKKADPEQVAALLTRQSATMKRLSNNEKTVALVFERGTLLQMAVRTADEFTQAKERLEKEFFKPLMESPVTAKIEAVERDKDGYVALVRVGWDVDLDRGKRELAQYLEVSDLRKGLFDDFPVIKASYLPNTSGRGPSPLSDKMYRYLVTQGVDLEVTLVGHQVRLPVFYSEYGHDQCSTSPKFVRGDAIHVLCLVAHRAEDADLRGISYYSKAPSSNPIRIRLTQEEAERATRVEAAFIRVRGE